MTVAETFCNRRRLAHACGAVLATLWLICGYRAVLFLLVTHDVWRQTGSINAWNDFAYSRFILVSYGICAGLGFGSLIIARRSDLRIAWCPIIASLVSGAYFVWRKPEEVIVMFPSAAPFNGLALCIFAALLAAIVVGYVRMWVCLSRFVTVSGTRIVNSP